MTPKARAVRGCPGHEWEPLQGLMARYYCRNCPATAEKMLDGRMRVDGQRVAFNPFRAK